MNEHTQPSVYSDHDEVLLLLPWYANGTLVNGDLEKVKNHLKVCLTCRRELAGFESLSANLRSQPSLEMSYKPSFDRLMVRIKQQEKMAAANGQQARSRGWLNRVGGWVAQWTAPKYLVPALATVTIAAFIPFLLRDEGLSGTDGQMYQTLAMPGSTANFTGSDVQVVFSGDASKQEIADLIAAAQGDILDGPSARGVYRIRIRSGHDLQESLTHLRQNERVVFAEPVLSQDNPAGK